MDDKYREHLLTCVAEECAEVIQAICKYKRFRNQSLAPVYQELNDVIAVIELLGFQSSDIATSRKKVKVLKYYDEEGK